LYREARSKEAILRDVDRTRAHMDNGRFHGLHDERRVLKVADKHKHSPMHQGYLQIPIHGGIELMVTCYLTPSLEAMILSPDAIGHELRCRGYTLVSNFDIVGCSLTLHHCCYASQDARFPLLLVQGLLYTEPLLPPMTDAERTGPMPASLRHHRRLLPMALPAAKVFDSPSIDETVVDVCQMSIDTGVAVPIMMNALPADVATDADDPRIAYLDDMFPWANPHGCHDGMACQCAAPKSFVDEQPSSPPPDPTLDLPPPSAPEICDCVDCSDRSGPPDVSLDVADKLLYIQRLGFQYDTPIEEMHQHADGIPMWTEDCPLACGHDQPIDDTPSIDVGLDSTEPTDNPPIDGTTPSLIPTDVNDECIVHQLLRNQLRLLWHQHLGHIHSRRVAKMHEAADCVPKVPIATELDTCPVCAHAL
jgi:hypothetical protein